MMNQETINRLSRDSVGIRQIERLLGMDSIMKQQASTRRLVRKLQDGTLGKKEGSEDVAEDDTHIQLGDNVYNGPQESNPKTSTLKAAALTAALLASGVGIGAAIPLIYNALKDVPTPAVDTDTDTQYGVGFGEPEDKGSE